MALRRAEISYRLHDPCTDVRMIVGPGRIKIPRASSPGAGSSNEGLVVEAVLVMAVVATIGVLIFAARVAGSRQSSGSASMSQAARQAAEYGYAEIMAELNRDAKSYLWITNFSNWTNVSVQDLKDCGVASSADPVPGTDPIPGVTSSEALSRSPGLSYRLSNYEAPRNLATLPVSVPAVCRSKFANLIGGTGVLTIVGTVNRGGYITTYTMKRTVSVNRSAPIFNNPITAPPANRISNASDSRFPVFPSAPAGTPQYYGIRCQPEGASTNVINCTAEPGPFTANFKSGTATGSVQDSAGSEVDYFPYIYRTGEPLAIPWDPVCQQDGANVRCLIKSMTVEANANMLVATKRGTTDAPVVFYLSENMTIETGAKLAGDDAGDDKGWSRFRILGVTSVASCGSQTITINSFTNSVPTPALVEPNLQHAFLWLSQGKLKYETSTSLDSIPALVGYVCEFETADGRLLPASSAAAPAYASTLSNHGFFDGLGGAFAFRGVFGGSAPMRFYYRGFGFNEQRLSS